MYCTYTFLEYDSKDIVACEIIDKRMTQLKSTNMEKEGLLRALRYLLEQGTNVCTDAHPQISALFSKLTSASRHLDPTIQITPPPSLLKIYHPCYYYNPALILFIEFGCHFIDTHSFEGGYGSSVVRELDW